MYKEGQNPSAWMLDVLGGPQTAEPNYPDLAEEYRSSTLYQVVPTAPPPMIGGLMFRLNPTYKP